MICQTVEELVPIIGTRPACRALGAVVEHAARPCQRGGGGARRSTTKAAARFSVDVLSAPPPSGWRRYLRLAGHAPFQRRSRG
jgi:hypothetical protein